jgi:hypothetical protein
MSKMVTITFLVCLIVSSLSCLPVLLSLFFSFYAFAELWEATISFVASVCLSVCLSVRSSAWNNSIPTVRKFTKCFVRILFKTMSRRFKFNWNLARITAVHFIEPKIKRGIIQCNKILGTRSGLTLICSCVKLNASSWENMELREDCGKL